ncbi:MAG: deoxynucleoside kinase [Flavobacteriales bacterium]|nr:deoxynucleoside kinase [Flavobacteriales bacterium]|tara:strand:+ start:41279 stop:41911 length:633 start_codon:yes stop_codon:yes gene_type:complete
MSYQFITIEGNIGVGKTTFSKMLANELNYRIVLEEFADNPFLPKFYEQPERYAFSLELFFMAERYRQLGDLRDQDLFSHGVVSDYFFVKSKLFAENNLSDDELLLFNRLSDIALKNLPKPDLIIYLHSDVSRLQQNIQKRGRSYEQNISDEYLFDIQNKYFDFFKKHSDFPILVVDVSEVDFVNQSHVFQQLLNLTSDTYSKGFHRISLT